MSPCSILTWPLTSMQLQQWPDRFTTRGVSKGQTFRCRKSCLQGADQFCDCVCRETHAVRWRAAVVVTAEVWESAGLSCYQHSHDAASECVSCCEWGGRLAGCVFKLCWLFCDCNFSKVLLLQHQCLFERLLWKALLPAEVSLPSDPHSTTCLQTFQLTVLKPLEYLCVVKMKYSLLFQAVLMITQNSFMYYRCLQREWTVQPHCSFHQCNGCQSFRESSVAAIWTFLNYNTSSRARMRALSLITFCISFVSLFW